MKRTLYTAILTCCVYALGMAQTTILDFEAAATSTVFQYFGSPLDGTTNTVIANPNASGINTSSMVSRFVKPAVAEVWAGAFSNPNPTTLVDLAANNRVTIKVHMDHIGSVSMKFEGSTNGGANWIQTVANTKVNQWEELSFDVSLPSIDPPNTAATGSTYARVVLFFDFGTAGTGTEVISYFDDIVAQPAATTATTILDFETAATGTDFQYFGSPLDGTKTMIITNPNPVGNTSANVIKYIKPAVAEVWAGAFSSPDPTTPIDFTTNGQVCVDVHMDHIGSLSVKLEGSTSMQPNWVTKVANTKINQWETLCFDKSIPSFEAPNGVASGVYNRLVVFFDFGTVGTGSDVTSYFDNVVTKGSSAPVARKVDFSVDMNNYTANFGKVYVSGTFNNWAATDNELTDPNLDGIFTGSIMVPNGPYEYKIQLDGWAVQEQFTGFEECTKTTGGFTNRLLLVNGDTNIPKFCYNSCYACGEEIKVNFRLGMNGVAPSADGVWIAGGGNFDVPGGRYKMAGPTNGVFNITVPRKRGFSSYYIFTNGACADYSCKESLVGLPCGVVANFNDRWLRPVTQDTTVEICFGTCHNSVSCVSSTDSPVSDAQLFQLLGNPVQHDGGSVLVFGNESTNTPRQIEITNSLGQQVHQFVLQAGQTQYTLPVADLGSGIYFVTVRAENRYFTRKLIK